MDLFRANVLSTLFHSFDCNQEVLTLVQTNLTEYATMQGFGMVLLSIVGDQSLEVNVRQAAGIQLRQYCEHHWDEDEDSFVPPIASDTDKDYIKNNILGLLIDGSSKMRTIVSMICGVISRYDYPYRWPNVLETLVGFISSSDVTSIQGGIRALVLFADEIDEWQLKDALQILSPALLRILMAHEIFSPRVRMRAISIYYQCVSNLFDLRGKSDDPELIKKTTEVFKSTLGDWCSACKTILSDRDVTSLGMCFGVRSETIQLLILLTKSLPKKLLKEFAKNMPELVTLVWELLMVSIPPYVNCVVNGSESLEILFDEDGDAVGVQSFLNGVLDFFGVIVQSSESTISKIFSAYSGIKDLVSVSISLLQMTDMQVSDWVDSVNEFISADVNEEDAWDVRSSAKFFLSILLSVYDDLAIKAISQAGQECLQRAAQENNWKLKEASILAIGTVAKDLPDVLQYFKKPSKKSKDKSQNELLDLNSFIEFVLLPDIASTNVLLQARVIWCGCDFGAQFPTKFLPQWIVATSQCLKPSFSLICRLSAARGMYKLCSTVENKDVFTPNILLSSLESLCDLLQTPEEDTLHYVLDAIKEILVLSDDNFVVQILPILLPRVLASWTKFSNDMFVSDCVKELFEVLGSSGGDICTPIIDIILNVCKNFSFYCDRHSVFLVTCIRILSIILTKCKSDYVLNFIPKIFRVLLEMLSLCEDHDAICYTSVCVESLVKLAGLHGVSLDLVALFQSFARLLDTSFSEEASSFVGTLVLQILKYTAIANVNIDSGALSSLLTACCVRLEHSTNPKIIRSLLLLFSGWINVNGVISTMNFLNSLPNISLFDQSVIDISPSTNGLVSAWISMILKWVFNQIDVSNLSPYYTKCSTHALCLLLSDSAVLSELHKYMVKGYPIISDNEMRSTRSKKVVQTFTKIPLTVKIITVLLTTWSINAGKENEDIEISDDDEIDDDNFEEINDEKGKSHKSPFVLEEDYLGNDDEGFYDDLDEDDLEDVTDPSDPVNQIEILKLIPDTFMNMESRNPGVMQFMSQYFSKDDMQLLERLINDNRK